MPALMRHAAEHGELAGYSNQLAIDPRELLMQPCDVLVPAAVERVIDARVAEHLQCRILAEGANGPTTPDADRVLDERHDGIFVIPDILCNAGGVDRQLFRMGAGSAAVFLGRSGGDEQLNTRCWIVRSPR